MNTNEKQNGDPRHLSVKEPSPWVCRFAPLIPEGGAVLDLACGGGRHARYLLEQGYRVTAIDKDTAHVADIPGGAEVIETDLEDGATVFDAGGPLAGRRFAGIVAVNYLHRPLLGPLIDALEDGGVLIYETFARGNELYTKPRNPDHLLRSGELLDLVRGRLQVIAYEHGVVERGDLPSVKHEVKQRICAVNDLHLSGREDGEPEPHKL